MPNFTVDINSARIATIGLAGLNVVDVRVHGALDRAPRAELDAMGGGYGEGGRGYLLWVAGRALRQGDVVRVTLNDRRALRQGDVVLVTLNDNDDGGDPGKTIAELYPDEPPSTQTDFSITPAMAADLRARPRLHAAFVVQAMTSSGQRASAASDERHTDFSFSVVWDRFQPQQARVRLATYCLDDVLARTDGTEHLLTTLATGDSATFSVVG